MSRGDRDHLTALKLGLVFNPPTLVLVYEQDHVLTSKPRRQKRKRSMPVRDLTKQSDCGQAAQRLKKRHEKYLSTVPNIRLEKLVRMLQLAMTGLSMDEAVKKAKTEFTLDLGENMNALSDQDLRRRKELMDLAFEKNHVTVGDPDFVYDKQVSRRSPKPRRSYFF